MGSMNKDDKPIMVEEIFELPIDSVWKAITEVEQMRKWFFENIPEFKLVQGFKVEFNVDNDGRTFQHVWRVTKVIPRKLMEINWRYGGYSGDSNVSFELEQFDDSTVLRLTHIIKEDFSNNIPEFKRESCLAGWRYFINKNLKQYLSKQR
jgi:uncharacterized protein YndB with AHSA1/START domain